MKFSGFLSLISLPLIATAFPASERRAISTSATSSPYYFHDYNTLTRVACSNGENGLTTRFGYQTLGDVPSFPYVAAGPTNLGFGWNSPLCGSCWSLAYKSPSTNIAKTINVTIIDAASTFALSQVAFAELAGSEGIAAGHVNVEATKISDGLC